MDGQGVNKDIAQGLKWLRRAADKGSSDAQSNMAILYIKGYPDTFYKRRLGSMAGFSMVKRAYLTGKNPGPMPIH